MFMIKQSQSSTWVPILTTFLKNPSGQLLKGNGIKWQTYCLRLIRFEYILFWLGNLFSNTVYVFTICKHPENVFWPRFYFFRIPFSVEVVYSFPAVPVTNGHPCSGLKRHVFVILQFWRSKSKVPFTGLISRDQQACAPPESSRGHFVSCLFRLLGQLLTFLGLQLLPTRDALMAHLLWLWPPASSCKDPHDYDEPTWIIQIISPSQGP